MVWNPCIGMCSVDVTKCLKLITLKERGLLRPRLGRQADQGQVALVGQHGMRVAVAGEFSEEISGWPKIGSWSRVQVCCLLITLISEGNAPRHLPSTRSPPPDAPSSGTHIPLIHRNTSKGAQVSLSLSRG